MAKEYSSKLTLKDNFTSVIEKAIKATEALKSKLLSTEKQLTTLGKKKISISAKLDSSVHSTLNKLGDKIPKDKVIHIKAKDEVTRTVTNMQRDIFKMSRDLNMGTKDPFKGLNRSSINAARNLATVRTAANALMTGAAMKQMAAGSILPALAGGAAAGRMSRGISAPTIIARSSSAKRRIIPMPMGKFTGHPDPDYYESKERFHRLGAGDVANRFNKSSRSVTSFDADRADMIARQKQTMKQRYGKKNYLSNYTVRDEHIGGGDYVTTLNKKLGRAGFAYQSAKESVGAIKIKLDVATKGAISKINTFKQSVASSKLGEVAMRVKFAGERGAYSAKSAFGSMKDKMVNIGFKVRDNGAVKSISSIYSKAKGMAGKTFSFSVKAMTSGAQKAIDGLKSAVKGLAMAAGAVIIGGATAGIKGAMEMEQNVVSIEHFVKYASTKRASEGKGAMMSDAEVKKASTVYMGNMRAYADDTSFSTGDVMDAGRRAVNVMSGDLTKAEELVKIAGDMAALNPGKTIMDAMEALADMKTGEMERMKEFGLKISADQFKGLVGKSGGDDLTEDETAKAYQMVMDQKLKTMFGGGANKMGGTASGKMSTAMGTASSALTDIGTMFLPGIKDALDGLNDLFKTAAPIITGALKPIAAAFNALASTEAGKKMLSIGVVVIGVATAFASFCVAVSFLAGPLGMVTKGFTLLMSGLKTASTVISVVRTAMLGLNLAFLANPITWVVAGIAALVAAGYYLWKNWDAVKQFFMDMWVGPSQMIANFTESAKQWFGTAADYLTGTWTTVKDFFTSLWDAPTSVVSGFVQSVYDSFGAACDWVISKWEAVKSAFSWSPSVNVSADVPEGADYSERAVGMDYIPYNGYKVSAHRGEAILSRTEADQWRQGRSANAGGVVININDPVVREEADLDRLGTIFANKLKEVRGNMGSVAVAI